MNLHEYGSKIIITVLFVSSVLMSGCAAEESKSRAVFDTVHKPVFKQYSIFRQIFAENGVDIVNGGIEDLDDAKAYILLGPAHRVDEREIVEFVRNGGILIIFMHTPPSNLPVLQEFGIDVESEPLKKNMVVGVPVRDTVLTENVERIILYGAFRISDPIIAEKREEIKFSDNIEMGLVSFKKFESGYVIVVGDDAGFTDQYIDSADNRVFAENLARFILLNEGG